MHVVGARFADLGSAVAARDAILASVAMAPADVAVCPLGTTRYDAPVEAYLLAGRFAPDSVDVVVRLVREHGGTVISSQAEWHPSAHPPAHDPSRRRATPRRASPRPAVAPRKRPRRPAARRRGRAAREARFGA